MYAINEACKDFINTKCVEGSSDEKPSISSLVRRVIDSKESHINQAKDNKWDRYNPILIGGDLFTMAYLTFQGVTACAHISLPFVAVATLVCGVVAGVITVGVAFVSLKESIQAFHNGDFKLGFRLLLDFIGLLGIGAIMILTPLAAKIAALGCLATFFAAYPWVLPLLFFVITIPLLLEIGSRVANIYLEKDLAADLKLEKLFDLLNKDIVYWHQISLLYENKNPFHFEIEDAKDLIERMEILQSGIGVTAAVEAFKLFESLLEQNREAALLHFQKLHHEISDWNGKQHVRLLQQVLFVFAFILSMAGLFIRPSPTLYGPIENFMMAAANAIPLYMDTFWPFERNTTLVVPKVEEKEIQENMV